MGRAGNQPHEGQRGRAPSRGMTLRIKIDVVRRWASFGVSVGIHVVLLNALLSVSWPAGWSTARDFPSRRNRELVELKKFDRVIWLPKGQSLPRISPAESQDQSKPSEPRPGSLYIKTEPPKPKFEDQFIQVPEPMAVEQAALPSPNVVMGGAALPPPPKPVERRQFVPPPERPRAAPDARIDEPDPALAAGVSGLPVEAASLANPSLIVNRGALDRLPKPPVRKMVAPAIGGERTAAVGAVEAPTLEGGAGQAGLPGEISAIILSGNPVPDGKLVQPAGNRPAAITAGSAAEAGLGSGGTAAGGGMVVPGVTVRDSSGGAPAGASGSAAAAPAATPTRMPYRPRLDTPSVSIAQWPSNRRVPAEVELSFPGRPVYSTVVPGAGDSPDINVWFGEQQPAPRATRVIMRPPRLDRRGEPAPLAGVAGAEKYWLKAKLSKEGSLTGMQVIRGPEGQQLAKVLESWQWTPAIKNGEAVEVDVVLEVVVRGAR